MDLSHDAKKVIQVLENAEREQTVETVVCERPGHPIQIADHIWPDGGIDIGRYRARQGCGTGAEMQDSPISWPRGDLGPLVGPMG
jgi:hypothetical protein